MGKAAVSAAMILLACAGSAATAAGPATAPSSRPSTRPLRISALDRAAIEAAIDQQPVTVHGTVAKAAWSKTGRVMNAVFKGAEDGLHVVVFQRDRAALDAAFKGDVAKTLSGATVEVDGRVERYEGELAFLKGQLQVIVRTPEQVRIAKPTTRPAAGDAAAAAAR